MEKIYTRKEIIDDIYVDYDTSGYEDSIRVVNAIKQSMMRMEEFDFMEFCKKENICLERFIKNRYYLKRSL